jgi:inner membrane protein
MATPITHAFFAVAGGMAATSRRMTMRFWLIIGLCAIAPDVDVLWSPASAGDTAMAVHRGFTHSLVFAGALAAGCVLVAYRRLRPLSRRWMVYWLAFFLAVASHVLLDMMVDAPRGVALLAPFSSQRFLLVWRPLPPFFEPSGTAAWRALMVATGEFLFIWTPMTVILWIRMRQRRSAAAAPLVQRAETALQHAAERTETALQHAAERTEQAIENVVQQAQAVADGLPAALPAAQPADASAQPGE